MSRQFAVRHQCPSCGGLSIRRSSRRESDRYGLHVMRSPYRCRDCGNRFWAVSSRTWAVLASAALLLAAAIASNAVWQMYDAMSTASDNVERLESAAPISGSGQ